MIAEEYFGGGDVWVTGGWWPIPKGKKVGINFTQGPSDSGTADAAVTTTDTTLTDTRESWADDIWIGAIVYCNNNQMIITDSGSTTVTGTNWTEGGNPGNGNAWSIATDVIRLPNATRLPVGYTVYAVNVGLTHPFHVIGWQGRVFYPTAASLETVMAVLTDNGTPNGTWYTRRDGTLSALGQIIATNREVYELEIAADTTDYDIRAQVDALGYLGVNPVQVSVVVKSGAAVVGSTTAIPAMRTGYFPPPFSSVSLTLEDGAFIIGMGGNGGDGGQLPSTDPEDGTDGGLALKIDTYTQITIGTADYTRIQGGGGGGGGGAQLDTGNTGDGGGGSGGPARGSGGQSDFGDDGASSVRVPGHPQGWTFGPPGAPEPGSDAGYGGGPGNIFTTTLNGVDGATTATASGGVGGLGGAAIHYTVPYVLIGDSGDRVYGDQIAKMAARGTLSLTGAGTLGDA
jgi:hypothetical protein